MCELCNSEFELCNTLESLTSKFANVIVVNSTNGFLPLKVFCIFFQYILNISSLWDFYAGLNLGFYNWNSPNDYEGSHNSGLGLGAQIGGRYFFNNKVGINLEFGGGNAFSG
jgi:hypothetical protein